MKKYIQDKLKKEGGDTAMMFICCTVFLFSIFYVITIAFTPFMVKADLIAYTKTLTRHIEQHGAIDAEIENFATELADKYKLKPKVTYNADYIAGTNHIQIRDCFTVTAEADTEIELLHSNMFGTIKKTITVASSKPGISEKLWK